MQRERNVLFNDALNTFYLRLYGVRHMAKNHSDSEKGNPLPPHRLLLSILLYAPSHRQDNSRGALAGTRNSSMGPPHEGSIRRPLNVHVNFLAIDGYKLHTCFRGLKLCCVCICDIDDNELSPKTMSPQSKQYVRYHTFSLPPFVCG